MKVTRHARKRWAERFPDKDIWAEFSNANQDIKKKSKKRILSVCKAHSWYYDGVFKGRYMVKNRGGIVFVVAPPEVIITAFMYPGKDAK